MFWCKSSKEIAVAKQTIRGIDQKLLIPTLCKVTTEEENTSRGYALITIYPGNIKRRFKRTDCMDQIIKHGSNYKAQIMTCQHHEVWFQTESLIVRMKQYTALDTHIS